MKRPLVFAAILATLLAALALPSARAGAPEPTYFLGDVNCDAAVDSVDAALLLQREAGLLDELACADNADMDADGSSNSVDAGIVLQYTAGRIKSRVQFALNVTRPAGLCDDDEKPTVCSIPTGTEFGLSIAINHPPPEGYIAFQTAFYYGDLRYNPASFLEDEIVWPESALPVRVRPGSGQPTGNEGLVFHGALSSAIAPFRPSMYRGDIVALSMSCSLGASTHTLALLPYGPDNPLGTVLTMSVGPIDAVAAIVGREDLDLDRDGGIDAEERNLDLVARLVVNCVEGAP